MAVVLCSYCRLFSNFQLSGSAELPLGGLTSPAAPCWHKGRCTGWQVWGRAAPQAASNNLLVVTRHLLRTSAFSLAAVWLLLRRLLHCPLLSAQAHEQPAQPAAPPVRNTHARRARGVLTANSCTVTAHHLRILLQGRCNSHARVQPCHARHACTCAWDNKVIKACVCSIRCEVQVRRGAVLPGARKVPECAYLNPAFHSCGRQGGALTGWCWLGWFGSTVCYPGAVLTAACNAGCVSGLWVPWLYALSSCAGYSAFLHRDNLRAGIFCGAAEPRRLGAVASCAQRGPCTPTAGACTPAPPPALCPSQPVSQQAGTQSVSPSVHQSSAPSISCPSQPVSQSVSQSAPSIHAKPQEVWLSLVADSGGE